MCKEIRNDHEEKVKSDEKRGAPSYDSIMIILTVRRVSLTVQEGTHAVDSFT